jgi:hypothetical protein
MITNKKEQKTGCKLQAGFLLLNVVHLYLCQVV